MAKYYFSCVIQSNPPVSVDLEFDNEAIARVAESMFKAYLDAEVYGVVLSTKKTDMFLNVFDEIICKNTGSSQTSDFCISLYKKNKFVCQLNLPNSETYYTLFALLRSYGRKYFVKKQRRMSTHE